MSAHRLLLCTAVMNVLPLVGLNKQPVISKALHYPGLSYVPSVFASVGGSHLYYASPALGISTFCLDNHFVGDYIQTCGYNRLFYFGISK